MNMISLKLNGNDVVVDWSGSQLIVRLGRDGNDPLLLSEDDIHTILRAANQVRRERWKAQNR